MDKIIHQLGWMNPYEDWEKSVTYQLVQHLVHPGMWICSLPAVSEGLLGCHAGKRNKHGSARPSNTTTNLAIPQVYQQGVSSILRGQKTSQQ